MRTYRRTKFTLAVITFLSVAFTFGLGGTVFAAEGTASSSECIKCHTDLKKMDQYGAASAAGAAAIAG
ncbi:MAG: hypothetical protein P8Z71_13450 [Candidatus Sulfobium sp.]|jgi:hypothetical protein